MFVLQLRLSRIFFVDNVVGTAHGYRLLHI